jgi:hypothetical protein
MSDLHKALGDISSIRKQLANTTEFRGYGPATLAATGGFAVLAAVAQAYWVPDPEHHLPAYLAIWVATAVVCASLTGVQMYTRTRRMHSGLSDEMLRMAVVQFLPSAVAGLLLTGVLVYFVPAVTWMLPGLWQVIFSIGIFSSCRFLPRAMSAAGVWYLATGLGCLSLAGSRALSPWTMGVAYGVGQLLIAGVLFLNAEGESDEV